MESVIASYSYRSRPIGNVIAFYSYVSDNVRGLKRQRVTPLRFEVTLPTSEYKYFDTAEGPDAPIRQKQQQ
jgi:hypothetical protein